MDTSYLAVVIAIGLIGLAFVLLLLLSVRSLFNAKHNLFSMVFFLVPVVIFGICYVIAGGDIARTAVLTFIGMFALGLVAILLSGVRSTFI